MFKYKKLLVSAAAATALLGQPLTAAAASYVYKVPLVRGLTTGGPAVPGDPGPQVPAPGVAELSASTPSIDFGDVLPAAGLQSRSFSMTNSGSAAATPGQFTSVNGFAISHDCGSLAPGDTCAVRVDFTPGAAGPHGGTTTLSYGSGKTLSVDVSATLLSVALQSAPSAFDFGTVLQGSGPVQRTLTLTNTGTAAVVVPAFASAPSGFSANHACGTLAPGASCLATITFTPSAVGAQGGTLVLNYGGAVSLSLAVSGTVAAPPPPTVASLVTSNQFPLKAEFAYLTATVLDANGAPLPNVNVTWTVNQGGNYQPSLYPVSGGVGAFTLTTVTDAAGQAKVRWTSTYTGYAQPVVAKAPGDSVGMKINQFAFAN